jgi:hypothetical protein
LLVLIAAITGYSLIVSMGRTPEAPPLSTEQLRLIDQSLTALHEEVAAVRVEQGSSLFLLVIAMLSPLAFATWLLFRAERSAVTADETVRCLIRLGLGEQVLRHYLSDGTLRVFTPSCKSQTSMKAIVPFLRRRCGKHWRRRRRAHRRPRLRRD